VRDFLLQTSVLPRLCAPLANAVTGRTDAARMLDEIQRGNLFLTALDDEGRWFRYHQLFRDLLAFELERSGLVEPTVLHRRASRVVPGARGAGRGDRHALASGDLGSPAS
jgi:LuxR family maltose regulon positive regulatory protein